MSEPLAYSYGYRRRWWTLGGFKEASTSGHPTPETARRAIDVFARKCGWTPRKWWQVWRWFENT